MIRAGLQSILLMAILAAGCSSGEDPNAGPTAPTSPSNPSTPTPPSNSCKPGAASNLRSSLSGSTRTLTWTAGANATAYDVQIGTTSGGSELLYERTENTYYTWTGHGSGTTETFYLRIHSHNSCGSGPPSAELVFH